MSAPNRTGGESRRCFVVTGAILSLAMLSGAIGAQDAAAPLRISLKTDAVVAGLPSDWPMYCGVPFGRGSLGEADVGRARIVTADGRAVPTQARTLATWNGTRDVRWLGVDFLGDPSQDHFLELAEAAAAPGVPAAAFLTEDADGFSVNTGPALFVVPRKGPLISRASLDLNRDGRFDADEELVRNDIGDDLYVVDNQGRRATIGKDTDDNQARAEPGPEELARQGDPVHACFRREGWYVTEEGNPVARHITRLHFYRGKSFVRIEHSLILTENTNDLWFREVGIAFRHRVPAPHPVVFDSSHEFDDEVFETDCPARGSVYMFQERAFFYSRMDPIEDCRFVIGRTGADGEDRPLREGNRCGEWVDATGPRGGVTLALRNLWQQHPKELEAAPGALTAKLWSNRGGLELDPRTETRVASLPKEWFNEEYHGGGSYGVYYRRLAEPRGPSNGLGMAKTHELLLDLHAPEEPAAGRRARKDAFQRPVLCLADPWQLWRSEAMEPLYPYDPERFPREEAFVEEYFDRHIEMLRSWGDYGFLDFGAGPHVWYRVPNDGPLQGRWMPYVARYSGQIDYGYHAHLWRAYARSGMRKYYELAEELNRQRIDMGMVHWDEPAARRPLKGSMRGKYKGGFAASDSPIYWGNSSLHHQSGTDFQKLYWFYYLRDYRFAHESAENYRDLVKRVWRESPRAVYGSRPFAVLNCLGTLYRETGDPDILAIGRAGLERFVDLESPRGTTDKLSTGLGKWDVKIDAVVNWYRATGDELAAKSVLRAARTNVECSMGQDPFFYHNSSAAYLNLAWRLSGDPVYVSAIRRNMDIATSKYYDFENDRWRNLPVRSAAVNRYPLRGMAVAMDCVARYGKPVDPIPYVQQTGFGPRCVAVFRKARDAEVSLYVRGRGPLRPGVFDRDGNPVDGVECEPIVGHLTYAAPSTGGSFRVRLPAEIAAGDYVLSPGSAGENWEVTYGTPSAIALFAPDGFVTGCGRVWESWPPRLWKPGKPILARPVWWHFAVPEGTRTFAVTTEKPIELLRPDDTSVASAAGRTGTFRIAVPPDARAGLWKFRAHEATTVKIQGVPPFFAADKPERFFLPDLSADAIPELAPSRTETPAPGPPH